MRDVLTHTATVLALIWLLWFFSWNMIKLHYRARCLQDHNDRALKRLIERELLLVEVNDQLLFRQMQAVHDRSEIRRANSEIEKELDEEMRILIQDHNRKK